MKFNTLKIETLINSNKEKTNILFIFPHPDDETMTSGALISRLTDDSRFQVFVISTTAGEHGDEKYKLKPEELGEIRRDEFSLSMLKLGVSNYDVWDYIDGGMPEQESEIKNKIRKYIKEKSIDWIVTFEKLGLYGHPDHIVLSKIVQEVSQETAIKVLYATLPNRIIKRLNLPKKLTYKDRTIDLNPENISEPEYKINGLKYIWKKYLAARKYKSQKLTGGKIPLLLGILFIVYEYYTTKYE